MQHSIARKSPLTLYLFCAALLLSCSQEMRQSFVELFKIQAEVATQYQVKDVEVKLHNNDNIIVSLINSPFNDLSEADQKAKAREIALLVKQKFTRSDTLSWVTVQFVSRKQVPLVNVSTSHHYSFTIAELGTSQGTSI